MAVSQWEIASHVGLGLGSDLNGWLYKHKEFLFLTLEDDCSLVIMVYVTFEYTRIALFGFCYRTILPRFIYPAINLYRHATHVKIKCPLDIYLL